MTEEIKKPKGFAAMTQDQRSAIASLGGIKAHQLGKAHKFTSDEAKVAGAKGGAAKKLKYQKKW